MRQCWREGCVCTATHPEEHSGQCCDCFDAHLLDDFVPDTCCAARDCSLEDQQDHAILADAAARYEGLDWRATFEPLSEE